MYDVVFPERFRVAKILIVTRRATPWTYRTTTPMNRIYGMVKCTGGEKISL